MGRKGEAIVDDTTGEEYASIKEAAEKLGVNRSSLANHLRGRYQSCGGRTFHYERLERGNDGR